jgi:hypothetical protein
MSRKQRKAMNVGDLEKAVGDIDESLHELSEMIHRIDKRVGRLESKDHEPDEDDDFDEVRRWIIVGKTRPGDDTTERYLVGIANVGEGQIRTLWTDDLDEACKFSNHAGASTFLATWKEYWLEWDAENYDRSSGCEGEPNGSFFPPVIGKRKWEAVVQSISHNEESDWEFDEDI